MTQLIGTAPHQVPTNAMLGAMARMDRLPANLQGMALLSTSTPSAASSVDLTGLDARFSRYIITFDALVPATNNDTLSVRTSSDGGSTFDSGGTDYSYTGMQTYAGIASASFVASTGDTKVVLHSLGGASSTATNGGISGRIELLAPAQATGYHHMLFNAVWHAESSGGVLSNAHGGAARRSSAAVNALRLYFAGGNITSGTVRVYGVQA
mgnify:FL=1